MTIERLKNKHYKWSSLNLTKENLNIYTDFLSLLEKQTGWKGTISKETASLSLSLSLTAESIMLLSDYLPLEYNVCEQMILQLKLQMIVLNKYKKGIYFLNLDDIIVIDRQFFMLANLHHVLDINRNDQLVLTYPMKYSKKDELFMAPELLNGEKELPFKVSITAGYYSLAKLCMHCLQLGDNLDAIMDSKMYFFLERCLNVKPNDRYFLYL